jgi:hypothetical protein
MAAKAPEKPVEHPQHPPGEGNISAAASHVEAGAREVLSKSGLDREGPSMATAALVGIGVAVLEPELIPGILIGAGAVLAPKLLPALGGMLRPLVKGMVKAGYSAGMAVREVVAEAGEQVQDIVAEARAEHEAGNGAAAKPAAASGHASKRQRSESRQPAPATNL